MNRLIAILFLILLLLLASSPLSCMGIPVTPASPSLPDSSSSSGVKTYTYRVINSYPHDRNAYTQGLVFENGSLYESTGRLRRSSLRRIDMESGQVLQIHQLPDDFFGEGITIFGNRIIQLTWLSHIGFVYDKNSFEQLLDFSYETEGWGIATDGKRLIMSDGSETLYFLDPVSFQVTGTVQVRDDNKPVTALNELEYINGVIYANIWQTDRIIMVSPATGKVTGWIDLAGLLKAEERIEPVDVLNGIAYDAENDRLFVTGKLWPRLFEIELIPVN